MRFFLWLAFLDEVVKFILSVKYFCKNISLLHFLYNIKGDFILSEFKMDFSVKLSK